MARIVLVTGGSRSGKSAHAQRLAESLPGRRVFVATCPALDGETRERIRRHQEARARADWHTIEETADLAEALTTADGFDVVLVDCLTLWIGNRMHEAETRGGEVTEDAIALRCGEILEAARRRKGTVIFVTNEVGMGIVPDNAMARRFRDLAGRCNQTMAAGADEVLLLTCGIPLTLKRTAVRGGRRKKA